MTIKMPDDDPKSNLIGFPIGKRKGTLEPVRKKYDACKHEAVFVEDGIREVTCQKCGVVLDAFTVLFELAWKQRRWLEELDAWDALRESRLSDRYDAQWERDHEAVVAPPADPSLREVWDVFHSYFGDKFCGMSGIRRRRVCAQCRLRTTTSILVGRVDAFRASTRFAPTFGVTMSTV
jgi:hypothetical protein